MKGEAFLDLDNFVAALSRRDRYHAQAVGLFGRSDVRWITCLLVGSKSHSWFLHRHGEEAARSFRGFLSALKGMKPLAVSLEEHERTLCMLDRFRGSKLWMRHRSPGSKSARPQPCGARIIIWR